MEYNSDERKLRSDWSDSGAVRDMVEEPLIWTMFLMSFQNMYTQHMKVANI